jgi:hypothetical protein
MQLVQFSDAVPCRRRRHSKREAHRHFVIVGQRILHTPLYRFTVWVEPRSTQGDALDIATFPSELDVIVSTGLGEFLDNEQLVRFYTHCHDRLRIGGVFVTSSMQVDRIADYLMRQLAELHTYYRRGDELIRWLHVAGFHEVSSRQDNVGLQTLVVARKHERRRPPMMAKSVL